MEKNEKPVGSLMEKYENVISMYVFLLKNEYIFFKYFTTHTPTTNFNNGFLLDMRNLFFNIITRFHYYIKKIRKIHNCRHNA